MSNPIGRNDPCPCGSGKKYKKCCLPKAGPVSPPPPVPGDSLPEEEPSMEEAAEEFLSTLDETDNLPKLLGWDVFDFQVDLFDPVIEGLGDCFSEHEHRMDESRRDELEALGLEIHATPEMRSRVAEELEQRAKKARDSETRFLAHTAMLGLEDVTIEAECVGLLRVLYHHHLLLRLLERFELAKAENDSLDKELFELARKAGKSFDENDVRELHGRLSGLGEGALPYLETFAQGVWLTDAAAPLIELAGRFPCARAAGILYELACTSETESIDRMILAALSKMPGHAWPSLMFRAGDPEEPKYGRMFCYAALSGAQVWDVMDLLFLELSGAGGWKEKMSGVDDMTCLAGLLTTLGDRRAVGTAVLLIHKGKLSGSALEAIRETYSEKGWWEEVKNALDALRRGETVLVHSGTENTDFIQKHLKQMPAGSMAGLNFNLSIIQQEWNNAYHEDLAWLRPADLAGFGPTEAALMKDFGEAFAAHARKTPELAGRELAEECNRFQRAWMRTPHPSLAGRTPLAAIWEEKRANPRNPAYEEKYRKKELCEMYVNARGLLEDGRKEEAVAELETILEIEPGYTFARRLIEKIMAGAV
jgi:hypothetical protein